MEKHPLPMVEELFDESGRRIGVTVRQGDLAWTFTTQHLGPTYGCGSPDCPRRQLHEADALPFEE